MHRPSPRPFIGAAGALLLGGVLLSGATFAQSPSPATAPAVSVDPCAVVAVTSPAVVVASPAASVVPMASPAASIAPVGSADPCASPAASAAPAILKVSANTATNDELIAALTAAGVARADRWAREIQEYRPYDTSDPTLQHLQDELAKYNPDPETLAGILSVLQP